MIVADRRRALADETGPIDATHASNTIRRLPDARYVPADKQPPCS
jgi:hypothetical protein